MQVSRSERGIVPGRAGAVCVLLGLLLAACGPTRPAATRPGAAAPAAPAARTRFVIDPARSELTVLVYRSGPMAALGHDHVISSHSLRGWAAFDGNPATAAFALEIPVADLVVDDEEQRAREGGAFAERVEEGAKAGTRHNMLGPAVLNAADFPLISVRSTAIGGSGSTLRAQVRIEVAGHTSVREVPFALDAAPGRLSGSGETVLSQSALGLTPFSVFMGALKVGDEVRVRFKFVAIATG